MINGKKYVMMGYSIPIIFTECHQHSFFEYIGHITSAGWFDIDDNNKVTTYGKSIGLNIGPDEFDAGIIERFLFK